MNSLLAIFFSKLKTRSFLLGITICCFLEIFVFLKAISLSKGFEAYSEVTLFPKSRFLKTPLVDESELNRALNRCFLAVGILDESRSISAFVKPLQHSVILSAESGDKEGLVQKLNATAEAVAQAQREYNSFIQDHDFKTNKDQKWSWTEELLVYFEPKITHDASTTVRARKSRGLVFLFSGTILILFISVAITYLISSGRKLADNSVS